MNGLLDTYDYVLPKERIASFLAEPRDSARLFVYNTKTNTISFATFKDIVEFLPKDSLMVLNNTKVVPARVAFKKETGGLISGLILINEGTTSKGEVKVIAEKTLPIGKMLFLGERQFLVTRQDEQIFYLKPNFDASIETVLYEYGTTPIPPYITQNTQTEIELRKRYQTIFAKNGASVAAPTASLHFTEQVFDALKEKGVQTTTVTLNVGMGTFAKVTEENIKEKKLHFEHAVVPFESAQKIHQAKEKGKSIIAVGTTVVRTLESTAQNIITLENQDIVTDTDLFIMPPYNFALVDILITNFHVPKSSLMCLVDAFLQYKQADKRILDLYKVAIEQQFRFYSFGDAMLIL